MGTVYAIVITIGDELLYGQTVDTNSAWIAQRLNDLGIVMRRRIAIGDDADAIAQTLDQELQQGDIVIITGGLGPTRDDITKKILTQYFGARLIENKVVLRHIEKIFADRNQTLLEINRSQADVPDNCQVLFNALGTAPGMLFDKEGKLIFVLPGVPYEMINLMEEEVLPILRRRFVSDAIIHETIMTAGLGESFVAERIKDLEAALPPHIRLAYLPDHRIVKLRLTGRSNDKQQLLRELQMRKEEIANRLEDILVAMEDLPLEQILGKRLSVMEKTVGLAESCSGGYIGHRLTQVLGASKYFQGSIVCYQKEIKQKVVGVDKEFLEEQGAVCEEVAKQMAQGARKLLRSNIGFGITGLLSPGGDDDKVPVGTVWLAVCDDERMQTRRLLLSYDRVRNKEVAVNMSLLFILQFVQGK